MALTNLTKPRARWATFKLKVVGAIYRNIYDKFVEKGISIEDFGAVGDWNGVSGTDNTTAINNALATSYKRVYVPDGDFLVNGELTSSLDGRLIHGRGRIISSHPGTLLTMSGDNSSVKCVDLDGGKSSKIVLDLAGDNPDVRFCKIHGASNMTGGSQIVYVRTLGKGRVTHNELYDAYSTPDGSIGNATGASRAVFIEALGNDRTDYFDVRNNNIWDILGEEGDAIHVQGTDVTPYRKGMVRVEGNTIEKCTRRAIKLQSSHNIVKNNIYSHKLTQVDSPNFAECIGSIGAGYNVISDNNLDAEQGSGVVCSGVSPSDRQEGVEVFDNNIRTRYKSSSDPDWDKGNQRAVLITDLVSPVVHNNNCTGGVNSIEAISCESPVVTDNNVNETGESLGQGSGVRIDSTCTSPIVSGNKGNSTVNKRVYFVSVQAPDAVVTDNHVRYENNVDESHGVVNLGAGALRAYVTGNTSKCNTFPAVSGTIDDSSYVTGNKNVGTGADGGSATARFVNTVPATPTSAGRAGDFVATSTHLYVCVTDNNWLRTEITTWV